MWYVSMGSGQAIADPFLGFLRRVFWPDNPPPVSEGKLYVCLALDHVIHLNTGGIQGPMQIAEIRKDPSGKFKATIINESDMEEHIENVRSLYDYIKDYPKSGEALISPKKPELKPE